MVILGTRNKITDFFMILAWASPFNNSNTNYICSTCMYHCHNFTLSLKFRGGADSLEQSGERCSNRLKRPHRIQGLGENEYL